MARVDIADALWVKIGHYMQMATQWRLRAVYSIPWFCKQAIEALIRQWLHKLIWVFVAYMWHNSVFVVVFFFSCTIHTCEQQGPTSACSLSVCSKAYQQNQLIKCTTYTIFANFCHDFGWPRWLSWMRRPTGDQEVAGSTPAEVGNILSWRLIMKYFLRSFSPFRWFKKGSCQFLAKECAQYWLTA